MLCAVPFREILHGQTAFGAVNLLIEHSLQAHRIEDADGHAAGGYRDSNRNWPVIGENSRQSKPKRHSALGLGDFDLRSG